MVADQEMLGPKWWQIKKLVRPGVRVAFVWGLFVEGAFDLEPLYGSTFSDSSYGGFYFFFKLLEACFPTRPFLCFDSQYYSASKPGGSYKVASY